MTSLAFQYRRERVRKQMAGVYKAFNKELNMIDADRELLEAAARAGGYHPVRWTDDGTALLLEGMEKPWNSLHQNPHSDCMGDALRLAVKLGMRIEAWRSKPMDCHGIVEYGDGDAMLMASDSDPDAAICRAITQAAAATSNATAHSPRS